MRLSFSEGDCTRSLDLLPLVRRTSERWASAVLRTKRRAKAAWLKSPLHEATGSLAVSEIERFRTGETGTVQNLD